MYCKYCGYEILENTTICPKCGAFTEIQSAESEFNFNNFSSDEVTLHELQLFIGIDNSNYYLEKWEKYIKNENSLSPSWNWTAFLFGFFWISYRKMYFLAYSSIIINLVSILVNSSTFTLFVNWSFCFLIALFSNKLYFHYAKNQVKKIKGNISDDKDLENKILNRGGTSIGALAIYILIYLLFTFIFTVFQ